MSGKLFVFVVFIIVAFIGCEKDESGGTPLRLLQAFVGVSELKLSGETQDVPVDRSITLVFSAPVNQASASASILLKKDEVVVPCSVTFLADSRTVSLKPDSALAGNTAYTIAIGAGLQGNDGATFSPITIPFQTDAGSLAVIGLEVNGMDVSDMERITDVPLDLSLTIRFSAPVDISSLEASTKLTGEGAAALIYSSDEANRTVRLKTTSTLRHLSRYSFTLGRELRGAGGETFPGLSKTIYTGVAGTPQMPVISDDALLTLVQKKTFDYFWTFGHPASGMARERDTSGDVVTTGGSGFGIMALVVAIERNFVSRAEGLSRMDKILTFLESSDRYHGVWPHWMNGNTGDVVPFSTNDNGGDLVETSFLIQGLLTFRQYLDTTVPDEQLLAERINGLWDDVEWNWYTKGENVLYWHWSPDKNWIMNHPIHGYNEALITYILAAASRDYAIDPAVYHHGWAEGGDIVNGKEFYGISLPLGYDYGGPLFFAHYSFLGLDPHHLQDTYANYWTQNVNHSLINHAHALKNPHNYVGYGETAWGFTASDSPGGYAAHSPTNDLGVISPTAALSSFPYTPEQSMAALKFFYYELGDRLWGPYGFYDAFSITDGWTADSYLAIDQGPIIVMIENYRSGLLWDLFMSAPEVQSALDGLGFSR